jgi:hypothetical protein
MVTRDSLNPNYNTSDVNIYDGVTLSCISGIVVGTSSLNDVIAAIDSAVCSMTNTVTSNITYDGADPLGSCSIDLTNGGDLNAILLDLANAICANTTNITNNTSSITSLDTCAITLCSAYSNCIGTYTTADTVDTLLTDIMDFLCTLDNTVTTAIDKYTNSKWGRDGGDTTETNTSEATTTPKVWVGIGGLYTDAGGLNATITEATTGESTYHVNGKTYEVANDSVVLTATKDNYIDYDTVTKAYVVTAVNIGDPAPSVTGIRLWKIETDATSQVSSTDLRNWYNQDGTRWSDDSVVTRHITDGNVTGAKLEDYATAGTVDFGFGTFDVDIKGRVDNWSSKVNITSLADLQVLQYQAGTDEWTNVDVAGGLLPAATTDGQTLRYNGAAYEVSNFLTSLGTSVGIGVNGVHSKALQMSSGSEMAFEIEAPASPTLIGSLGGSMTADEYFYAVVAVDSAGGLSYVGDEDSITIDGIAEDQVDLSWSAVHGAVSYRIYKGLATGTYTEYFTTSNLTYTDTGAAGTAGSAPTGATGFSAFVNKYGIGIGGAPTAVNPFGIVDTIGTALTGVLANLSGTGYTSDVVAVKGFNTTTNTANNYGGWFKATGGAKNIPLRLENGVDNTGKILYVANGNGEIDFKGGLLLIKDEGGNVETETTSIDFVGSGVNAVTDGSGNVTVTITGAVTAMDDLSDVTTAGAISGHTLRYNGSQWVTNGVIFNDGSDVRIGDSITTDARLHIYDVGATTNLFKVEGIGGVSAVVSATGEWTINNFVTYTEDNGGLNPPTIGYVLADLDGTGKLSWADPTTLAGLGDLQSVTNTGNTTTNNIVLQDVTVPNLVFDNTSFEINLTGSAAGSSKTVTLPDFTSTLIGAVSGLSPDYLTRATDTHLIAISSVQDDGTTTGLSVAPTGTDRLGISTSLTNAINIGLTQVGADTYGINITANVGNTGANYGMKIVAANGGGGTHNTLWLQDGNEGAGRVLVSDATGKASWSASTGVTGSGASNKAAYWNGTTSLTNSSLMEFAATEIYMGTGTTDYGATIMMESNTDEQTLFVNNDSGGALSIGMIAAAGQTTPATNCIGGYFLALGGTSANYSVQLIDGTEGAGKFLKDVTGSGSANWANITVADVTGAIDISGTPVNDQIAIWTDADTLEGQSTLTYTGGWLYIGNPAADSFRVESTTGDFGWFETLSGNDITFQFATPTGNTVIEVPDSPGATRDMMLFVNTSPSTSRAPVWDTNGYWKSSKYIDTGAVGGFNGTFADTDWGINGNLARTFYAENFVGYANQKAIQAWSDFGENQYGVYAEVSSDLTATPVDGIDQIAVYGYAHDGFGADITLGVYGFSDYSAGDGVGGRFKSSNASGTNYSIWLQDGTEGAGKFLKSITADGKAQWADADVNVSGTPLNNQIAVWTNSNTLEGDTAFLFDTTTNAFYVGEGGQGTLHVGGTAFSDQFISSSGSVITLQNIDALDSTTEGTIENAIDTLPNLLNAVSLQSVGTIISGTWQGTAIAAAYLDNHDNLTGFVANEHIDHTSVTITAGVGLTGGGDISANRTIDLDISSLPALTDAGVLASTDTFAVYNTSALANEEATMAQLQTYMQNNLTFTTDTNLTQEEVEDYAGALVANATGTHTGISITYQDATGDMDFVVDHDTAQNYNSNEHISWVGVATNFIPYKSAAQTAASTSIRSDGTTLAIGTAPLVTTELYVSTGLTYGIILSGNKSTGTQYALDIDMNHANTGANYGVRATAANGSDSAAVYGNYAPTSNTSWTTLSSGVAVVGQSGDTGGDAVGVLGMAATAGASTGTYIGGMFYANNGTNNYAVKLTDGTEGITKFLTSIDANGHANWQDIDDFTADGTPDGAADYVLTYDASAGIHKKVLLNNLPSGGGGINNVVEDTTPQLGGNLDYNGFAITNGLTEEQLTFIATLSAVNHINIQNAATSNAPIISAVGDDANVDLSLQPKGTGDVIMGNYTFDGDQTVGAGQDNYVLTYDNGSGLISLEAAAGGSSAWTIVTRSSGTTYSASVGEMVVVATATHAITLPTASGNSGERIGVKVSNATVTDIEIYTTANETLDGTDYDSPTGLAINNQYDSYIFFSDGTNWFIES